MEVTGFDENEQRGYSRGFGFKRGLGRVFRRNFADERCFRRANGFRKGQGRGLGRGFGRKWED